jgi:hypothetical protein
MRVSFNTLNGETQLVREVHVHRNEVVTMKPSTTIVTHATSRVISDDEVLLISHPKAALLEATIVVISRWTHHNFDILFQSSVHI